MLEIFFVLFVLFCIFIYFSVQTYLAGVVKDPNKKYCGCSPWCIVELKQTT